MKIGIMGSGDVGQTLAAGFIEHGHEVTIGTRSPEKLAATAAESGIGVGTFRDAAAFGEVLVLAVKGTAALDVAALAGVEALGAKPIIDTTNAIADAPPVDGVLVSFTGPNESLMEQLQEAYPNARFVKCFSSVGSDRMVDPDFPQGKPTMFICGNDNAAKRTVSALVEEFGWNVADMGKAIAARAIEPLAVLWCIPGFLKNQWTHAFALFT